MVAIRIATMVMRVMVHHVYHVYETHEIVERVLCSNDSRLSPTSTRSPNSLIGSLRS